MSPRWKNTLYRILYVPVMAVFHWLFSYRFAGGRNVPAKGGLLVIANHQSYLDPPMIGAAVKRQLTYLAKKSLFRLRPFRWLIETLGAIPINIDASGKDGIKLSLSQLELGKAVLVFPEGRRTPDGAIHDFKPGIVLLIRRAQVPILPTAIAGAYDAWKSHAPWPSFAPLILPAERATVAVVVGAPVAFETVKDMEPEAMMAYLRAIVVDLREKAEKLRRKP